MGAFLREPIGLDMFSAGRTLGLRQRAIDSPHWSAAWVRFAQRGALGYNADLTGSNLWPGKSCGRTIAPIRAIA